MEKTCRSLIVALLIIGLIASGSLANPMSAEPAHDSKDDISLFIFLGLSLAVIGIPVAYALWHHAHSQPQAEFFQEAVTFTVHPEGSVHVSGDYFIYNLESKACHYAINYPFPDDAYLSPPQNPIVQVRWETDPETLQVSTQDWEWQFNLPLDSADTSPLHVEYDQATAAPRFKYILTSTLSWGEPLDSARFTICLPQNYQLTSASYDYQTSVNPDDCNVYTISQADFTPDRELEFAWQPMSAEP
jgi:hypothetical protein